jgi:signal transduction histidine kinase
MGQFLRRFNQSVLKKQSSRDALIVASCVVIFWGLLVAFEGFEWFYEYSRAHEDWDLDEIVLFFVVLPLPLMWFAFRRANEAAQETNRNLIIERELSHLRKVESLGTLAGGMAHELNNQLQPVIALSELTVATAAADDPRKRQFELILAGAERARATVGQILRFSRRNENNQGTFRGPDSVRELVEFVSITCSSAIGLNIDVKNDFTKIKMAWENVETVIVNLFSNAIAAMEGRHGAIGVTIGRSAADAQTVTITVSDQGSGISDSDKARIFEPFFTTKEVGSGTGLGMWQVQSLISEVGGQISFETTVDVGTTFTVVLPAE